MCGRDKGSEERQRDSLKLWVCLKLTSAGEFVEENDNYLEWLAIPCMIFGRRI